MSRQILGLSGYAGTGKDTVAERLVDKHDWQRVAFADILRDALYALDPLIATDFGGCGIGVQHEVDRLGWDAAKRDHPEVRALLQRMGTEVGRELFGTDFWVQRTFDRMPAEGRIVITDCRFENEARAVTVADGVMWRVERPGCKPVNDHPSETALDDYAFTWRLQNAGTIDELHAEVDTLAGWFA